MNRYQKIASKLAKDIKLNTQFNTYNFNKNLYLHLFKDNSWPINKVLEFKNNRKEKVLIDENMKLITDFIDSVLKNNNTDTFVSNIEFELVDDCNIRESTSFFQELDTYFNKLGATYSYSIKDKNFIQFSVFLELLND